jgi:hypothetical protein
VALIEQEKGKGKMEKGQKPEPSAQTLPQTALPFSLFPFPFSRS